MKLRLKRRFVFATISSLALGLAASCTATKQSTFDDDGEGSTATSGSSTSGELTGAGGNDSSGASAAGGVNFTVGSAQGGSTGSGTICDATPDEDKDMDGYSINEGDCNDCDPNVSPGAIEVPTDPMDPMATPADENCNDQIDEF